MYQHVGYDGNTLGISLKPPSWLRDIGTQVVKGISLTVPTPAGPIALTPQQIAAAVAAAARGTTVTYTPPMAAQPSLPERIEQQVPGGFGTIAAVGIGALVLLMMMGRRR